ncbi:MAG: LysO family transporter, partial [Anaerolineaceae bacterium]
MDVLLYFAAGAGIGWIIRKRPKLVIASNWGSSILLGLLIFIMGLSTGGRADIMSNLSGLGFSALLLALGGIAGSILFTIPA